MMSGTPEGRGNTTAPGTVLAFDFGTRKIGVALGNTVTGTARPLLTLHEQSRVGRLAAIGLLIKQWGPAVLVVGRPLYADASEHAMTALADQFARDLEQRFGLPVVRVDERYTTQLAELARRAQAPSRRDDPGRDAMAAQLILQAWLDAAPSSSP